MQLQFSFDSSCANAPAGFFTALQYVQTVFDQLITNPISVTIDVGYGEIAGQPLDPEALGESLTNTTTISYAQAVAALTANAASATAQTAAASLPTTDPTDGAGVVISTAQELALGLLPGVSSVNAGSIGFSTGYSWAYDPNNLVVSGEYDFIAAAEHEVSEALGRISELASDQISIMDLFRYSAPGVLATAASPAGYFSINGGVTGGGLGGDFFNGDASQGDLGDWFNSATSTLQGDAFAESEAPDGAPQINPIVDVELMNAIGFSVPSTIYPADNVNGAVVYDGGQTFTFSGDVTAGLGLLSVELAMVGYPYQHLGWASVNETTGAWSGTVTLAPGVYSSSSTGSSWFDMIATNLIGDQTDFSFSENVIVAGGGPQTLDHIGADLVVGGGGVDVYDLAKLSRSQVAVGENADGSVSLSTPDGVDALYGVDWLQFSDGSRRYIGPPIARDDFNADGRTDLLIENTSGAVVVGEAINGAESYSGVAALGPVWSFKGNGDLLGDGKEDFLVENTSGAVVVGEVANGATSYTQVGALGPEWTFQGTGDFLNNGQDQFLIENTAGAVVVGNVVNGQAQYSLVTALGPEWSFEGTGDFLNDGATGFLIENASGAVDVGEIANGTTSFTQIGALESGWKFVGTGDFLGDGHDQFLIENTNGALYVANVVNGQAQYTNVGALGPEWSFIGTGDYLGAGVDGFMIENTAGAVVLGTIANGQASYAQVGALGKEWTSRS